MNDDEVEISARRFLDGYEIFINAKGGSAKEAYANLEQYAEDLGCAPAVRYELKSGAAPTIAAPAAEKPGRVRRTQEQIAADKSELMNVVDSWPQRMRTAAAQERFYRHMEDPSFPLTPQEAADAWATNTANARNWLLRHAAKGDEKNSYKAPAAEGIPSTRAPAGIWLASAAMVPMLSTAPICNAVHLFAVR